MADKISRFTLTVEMFKPTNRELIITDLADHIAPLISQGCLSGEVLITGPRGGETRGWWNLEANK
jgi:hypothetical protein